MTEEEQSGFTVVDKRRVATEAGSPESSPQASEQDTSAQTAARSPESAPAGTPDPTPTSPTTEAHTYAGSPDESPDSEGFPHELPRLTVRDRLFMCIDVLQQGAWISMGLVADPATGQIEKDMAGAKTAIDCVAFLVEKVEGDLDESIRRELRRIVSDLRINFVQQSSR